jgi:single-stranded DNA-specific DHH superfamily exonuclease
MSALLINLLMTNDEEGGRACRGSVQLNMERRQVENRNICEASKIVESAGYMRRPYRTRPQKMASRRLRHCRLPLADRYGVPAVIICIEGDEGRGPAAASAALIFLTRSIRRRTFFPHSAGTHSRRAITLKKENIDQFRERFAASSGRIKDLLKASFEY